MRQGTIAAVLLGSTLAMPANGAWLKYSSVDRLTDQKRLQVETKSRVEAVVGGRSVFPVLTVSCVRPSDVPPYLGLFIVFPLAVRFSAPDIRYRFDERPVVERKAGASRDGTYFQIVGADHVALITQLTASSCLRVELKIPTQDLFMDFDTRGGSAAFNKIGCNRVAAAPAATANSGGGYVVQISSQKSEAEAQASIRALHGWTVSTATNY
jgi:hypothetical protein